MGRSEGKTDEAKRSSKKFTAAGYVLLTWFFDLSRPHQALPHVRAVLLVSCRPQSIRIVSIHVKSGELVVRKYSQVSSPLR
jgi:hypothetical protein